MATLLLVDDSDTVREILRLVAAADGRLQVIGEAVNGRDAAIAFRPESGSALVGLVSALINGANTVAL